MQPEQATQVPQGGAQATGEPGSIEWILDRLIEKAGRLESSRPRVDNTPGPTAGFAVTLDMFRQVHQRGIDVQPVGDKNGEWTLDSSLPWLRNLIRNELERSTLARLLREVMHELGLS